MCFLIFFLAKGGFKKTAQFFLVWCLMIKTAWNFIHRVVLEPTSAYIGLYAKIMVAQLPWWDYAGKYAKHMLKDWINKRLTRRIEIKTKLNIVDERLNFLLLKTKIVYLLLFLRMSPSKNHNIALNSVHEIIWGGDRRLTARLYIPPRYLIIHYVIFKIFWPSPQGEPWLPFRWHFNFVLISILLVSLLLIHSFSICFAYFPTKSHHSIFVAIFLIFLIFLILLNLYIK